MESHNLTLELPATRSILASDVSKRFKESKTTISASHLRISSGEDNWQ
jgi:hypothetical protein